jgi:hypothetical protein
MGSSPPCRALCPSRWLSLVCKIPVLLLSLSETNTIGYLEDEAFRHRIRTQLNKGEKLHDLRKFLFFAREGVVSQQYEEGQTNQAGCLNLLTNAVIVWNTVYMQAALNALRAEGYPVREEDLGHLWPTRFAHVHRYGKYAFNIEAARTRTGLRPLTR